jgi:phosphoglycerol transferase
LCLALQLWRADLRIPLNYAHAGDSLLTLLVSKTTLENGSYLSNCRLAAPGCQYHYGFPWIDSFHLQAIALLARLSGNLFLALNLYFLCGPVLASITACYTLRRLGIRRLPAICGALLYALLPFFFLRGLAHTSLALYALCPFALLFCTWILESQPAQGIFFYSNGEFHCERRNLAQALIVCLLAGSTNVYYAAFFCMLFGISTAVAFLRSFEWRTVLTGALLAATVALAVGGNLIPVKLDEARYGVNPEATLRNFSDAELFAVKLDQMLLPISNHRLPFLAMLKARYNRTAPLVNENDFSSLGMVLSVGLLGLFFWPLLPRRWVPFERVRLLDDLSVLTWASFALCTIGGFGALIAFFITDKIRAYNRITPILAFFCVTAVSIAADLWLSTPSRSKFKKFQKAVTILVVTGWGLFDQIPTRVIGHVDLRAEYELDRQTFQSDRQFFNSLESRYPQGAMVFQLPYHSFPEAGPVAGMEDYDHFRGYLLTSRIHWSYGGLRGLWEDVWNRKVTSVPTTGQMLRMLSIMGFSGIFVDRNAYPDHAADAEKILSSLLGAPSLVSANSRYSFFDLSGYAARLHSALGPEQWKSSRERLEQPVFLRITGCSLPEHDAVSNWRWCNSTAKLVFYNRADRSRKVELDTVLATGYAEPSNIWFSGMGFSDQIAATNSGTPYRKSLLVPPGRSEIDFRTDVRPVSAPTDPRPLYFRFVNLGIHEAAWTNSNEAPAAVPPDLDDSFLIEN